MNSQDKTRVRKDNDAIENSIDPPVEDSATHVCRCGNPGHINLLQWTETVGTTAYWDQLESDSLDMEQITREIKKAQETIQIVDEYCSSCRKFLEALPDILINQPPTEFNPINRPHFQNMAEFGAALREKCRMCRLLDQAHTEKSPFQGRGSPHWARNINVYDFHKIENRLRCLGKPTTICMMIQSVTYDDGIWISLNRPGMFKGGYNLLGHLSITHSEFSALKSTPAPKSDRVSVQLQIANQWLAECLTSHVHCCQNPTEFFPSRLIYVGEKFARLVVTSTLDHRPKYATLSHCWGAIPYLMLKTTSIDSMMIKIPEDDLTKTFQDAIRISRALGIEYIWIDSLCIIQDSSSDWQAEAVLMQSVYSSSEINIAATGAADGRQGCFLQPQDYIAKVHVRKLKPPSDKSWDISNLSDCLDYMPLTRRAWALQERLLSTRTLHFSEREMVWECKTGGARENYPRIVKRKQEKTSLAHMWDSILGQYTSANLTNKRDKLIAIGGIARAVQLESGDRYLAGLWEKDIEVKLLWLKGYHSVKSDVYRAPSWSWASIDGRVNTDPLTIRIYKGRIHVHVVSAFVAPLVGESPFGEVRAGNLRISCKALLSGNIHKADPPDRLFYGKNWSFNLSNGEEILSRYEVYLDSEIDEKKVVLLLVYDSGPASENQESRGTSLAGLVLQRSGVRKGEFLRVGLWSVSDNRGLKRVGTGYTHVGTRERHDNHINSLFELFKTNETETAMSDYAEILAEPKYPNERYIINII
ncbi:hypothetical protein BOTCAL_0081g00010 [Botryotinia calthae]|uniref:Heterokaryon incompatibility domain-containing protein n=1 Tax=Botryotinia calthae TaxID=38488 RepID=A0A4Y8DAD5_9HELO|nr:hypothetical protein BOTCAL_0081g00010 [Botryotinia calthae]